MSLDTTLTNNFETGEISLNGKIANSEEEENIDYSIDLTYADENDIAGYLIDNKTGEAHPFDTRLSEASEVPLVVVAVMAARFGVKWTISKNNGQPHGGSYWKLINNKGKRIASLTKEGKILRE